MSEYQIVGASLSEITRYITDEPSLSVRVEVGVALDGGDRINIGIPVDLPYDPSATIQSIEDAAFVEAVKIFAAIVVPDAATLTALYRKQFTETL